MNTRRLPSVIKNILVARRKRRVEFMLSKIATQQNMSIIDIGCGVDSRSFDAYIPSEWSVTGIDILPPEKVKHDHQNFNYIQQNAQDLSQFKDQSFDLAVSIGMLEHITDRSTYYNIVAEIRRVAKQYIVIVPYKYCWIEPHYGIPFFPIFPYSVKLFLVKTFNLSGHKKMVSDDPEFINKNYRWPSNSEYLEDFQDATIFLLPTLEMIAITRKINLK